MRERGRSIAFTCGLIAFVGLVLIFCLSGCAVGFDANGEAFPCIRLDDPEPIVSGAKALGGVVGTLIGGPAGASIGTAGGGLIATGLTAFFMRRSTRARDQAFDEGAARAAGVQPSPAVPITPKA